MKYEDCARLVDAFEAATLLHHELLVEENKRMAGDCADAIGEFIAAMMASETDGERE